MSLATTPPVHDAYIETLRSWIRSHEALTISADVTTSIAGQPSQARHIAQGRIVGLEEHPSSPGVHRVIFDSRIAPSPDLGRDVVTVGWEVTAVTALYGRLWIEKGPNQTIVLTAMSSPPEAGTGPPPPPPAPPSRPATWVPPIVTPPPVRGKGKRGRWWLGVLGLLIAIGAVGNLLGDAGDDGLPPRSTDQPPAVAPSERMDRLERDLFAATPYYDCAPIADARLLPGAIAGISCHPVEGRVATVVKYYRFRRAAEMDRYYADRLDRFDGSPGVTILEQGQWCQTTQYTPVCYGYDGEMFFYRKGGVAHAEWTAPDRIYSTASRADGNYKKLRETWSEAGP